MCYAIDGKTGLACTILLYIGNSWLYLANMLIGRYWLTFLMYHINTPIPKKLRIALDGLFCFGVVCLIINIFYPIVFVLNNNVYERTSLYWIFVLIAGFYLFGSVYIYYSNKKRNESVGFFSINAFIIPVVIGVTVQSLFYGISVIWASVAVAIAGIMSAMNNDIIFMDNLTGIYNRIYLEALQKSVYNRKNTFVTGVMIDVNDFKSINDKYGHATGDEALIDTANILSESVGKEGTVMRYAGDEFVIMLNTVEEEKVESIIKNISAAFEYFNNNSNKPYKLSVSIGYSALDLKNQTMNDFMNTIDKKMYDSKEKYYKATGKERRK